MRHTPAVALLGPRQVGKTTLAQTIAESRPALYLDIEAPEDLLKLSDPSAFLSLHGGNDESPIEKNTVVISLKHLLLKLQDID